MFVDSQQRARAFSSYFFVETGQLDVALSTLSAPVKYALDRVRQALLAKKPVPPSYTLGLELGIVRLGEARDALGLSEAWVERIARAADEDITGAGRNTRDALKITNVMAGTEPANVLQSGDLVLELNGKTVVSYQTFETAAMVAGDTNTSVKIMVLREGRELLVECAPHCVSALGTQRIVKFCGMQVQEPHPHVRFLGFIPKFLHDADKARDKPRPGVFISSLDLGSPAEAHGVYAPRWIAEMNHIKVTDLDEFMDVVIHLKQGDIVRIVTMGLDEEESVHALDVDLHYFPLTDLRYDPQSGVWSSSNKNGVFHW